MKTLYLIGGPMGVGKTTVSRVLQKTLDHSVFLDGDWCWDAHPFLVTEETKQMVLCNIRFLLNQFLHCSAYHSVIFCWVLHEQAILDAVLAARTNCAPACCATWTPGCAPPTWWRAVWPGSRLTRRWTPANWTPPARRRNRPPPASPRCEHPQGERKRRAAVRPLCRPAVFPAQKVPGSGVFFFCAAPRGRVKIVNAT